VQATIDLTKPLNSNTQPYQDGEYQDPPFVISNWCKTCNRGFWVSKVEMGTQTGTHIDAPAHFVEGAATLDQLEISTCFGSYFLVHLGECEGAADFDRMLSRYRRESRLLLLSPSPADSISSARFDSLLSLGCKLWIVMGAVTVEASDPFYLHRKLAQAGVYLVEDLDEKSMDAIQPDGEIMALPLRLEGVSGAPCRVVISMKRNEPESVVE